ncbi:MAG TPA: TIGR02996 domain-containing protein [Planctomycetota bacterium]|nr:TIGR02996 domain-containing protein [Planctomycetota bacterium]
MNERERFIEALEKNEDDVPLRLAFADWLDDEGEHEEADRQRKWPASKAWIIGFCEDHQSGYDSERLTYKYIMQLALEAAMSADENTEGRIHCGSNMGLCYSRQWHEFWKHWSVVSGIALKPEVVENIRYSCSC